MHVLSVNHPHYLRELLYVEWKTLFLTKHLVPERQDKMFLLNFLNKCHFYIEKALDGHTKAYELCVTKKIYNTPIKHVFCFFFSWCVRPVRLLRNIISLNDMFFFQLLTCIHLDGVKCVLKECIFFQFSTVDIKKEIRCGFSSFSGLPLQFIYIMVFGMILPFVLFCLGTSLWRKGLKSAYFM